MSQTQVLLTKIITLCSEIRDIKNSQNKYYSRNKGNTRKQIITLSKTNKVPYNRIPVSLDTHVSHDQHGGGSSHSTPSSPSHLLYKTDKALPYELTPSQILSSPTPPEGEVPNNSLLSSLPSKETSVSVGVSSEGELSGGEGCGTSMPIWREGGMEQI